MRSGNTQSTNGLKQILIANYAKELFFERIKMHHDTFTIEKFDIKTKPNIFLNYLHNISVKITYLAMKRSNNKKLSLFLFGLAAVLSPFQLKLFFNKIIIKKYLNGN